VGGGYETCAKDGAGSSTAAVRCSGIIAVDGKGKTGYPASRSLTGAGEDGHAEITGVITGGSGTCTGATGEMVLTPPTSGGDVWRAEFR
jgi:hypothetical protein